MASYNSINPNDFTVHEAIAHMNNNLDYLYNLSQNGNRFDPTKVNLIPYADFSIYSNLEYWQPYKDSILISKDDSLYAYSLGNIVGVISPVINTQLIPNKDYTIVLTASCNKDNAILNEAYLQRADLSSIKLNIDVILDKGMTTYYLHFKVKEYIKNFRIILGIGTTIENSKETFVYDNLLLRTSYIQDDLVVAHYDINSEVYDNNNLIDSLYYMLLSEDYTPLDKIMSMFSNNQIPSTKSLTTYSLLETFLLNLLKIKLEVQGVSRFIDAHIPIFDHLGILYKQSLVEGLIPNMSMSDTHSLLLSLYTLDMIELWITNKGNLVTENYNLEEISQSIRKYIDENLNSLLKDDFIQGAITVKQDKVAYSYLDYHNNPSSSIVSLFYQVELVRLLVKTDHLDEAKSVLKNIMSYKKMSKAIIPSAIHIGGTLVAGTEVSISTACLVASLLKDYPTLLDITSDELTTHIVQLNYDSFYKYDYTSNGNIFSSNQYFTRLLSGLAYTIPNIFVIKDVALYDGNVTDKDIIMNPNNSIKDVYNRIEAVLGNSDIEARLVEVELTVSDTSIIASVTSSREWQTLLEDIEINSTNVLNKVDAALSQIVVDTQGIINKVMSANITEVLQNVTLLGNNLIENSLFVIGTYDNWDITTPENIGIYYREDGKIFLKCLYPGVITSLSQNIEILQTGDYVLSFDAYGNGTISVTMSNGEDNVSTVISPNVSSSRFEVPITITKDKTLNVEITLNNGSSLQMGYVTLCKGRKSVGWYFNENDFTSLLGVLSTRCDALIRNINDIDLQNNFYLECNIWNDFVLTLLQNQAIIENALKYDLTIAHKNYLESINDLRLYLEGDSTENINDLINNHTLVRANLLNTLKDCNKVIINHKVDMGGDAAESLIRGDFEKIVNEVTLLYDNALNTFMDEYLLDSEVLILQNHYNALKTSQTDLASNLVYFDELILDENNMDLIDLHTVYDSYMGTLNLLLEQLNTIIVSTHIAQDMRYKLNGYIQELQEDETLKEQFIKVYRKYSNEKLNTLLTILVDAINNTLIYLNDLKVYVEDSLDDDSMTYLEGVEANRLLQAYKDMKLDLDVEISYYMTQLSIDGTSELSSLKASYNQFTIDYMNMVELLDSIIDKNILDTTLETWVNTIDSLEVSTYNLAYPVQKALQQIIAKSHESYVEDTLYNVKQSIIDINNVSGLIYEFDIDNLLESLELQTLGQYLMLLESNQGVLQAFVSNLIRRDEIANTIEASNLTSVLSSFAVSCTDLTDNIREIMRLANVENVDYNVFLGASCEYRLSLALVQEAILRAYQVIDNHKIFDNAKLVETLVSNLITAITNFRISLEGSDLSNILDNYYLFKQRHLEIIKQVDTYLDSLLTPELVGETILFTLNNLGDELDDDFESIQDTMEQVIRFSTITSMDKADLNEAIDIYLETLNSLGTTLDEVAFTLKEIDTIEGNIYSAIREIKNSEFRITDEYIISVVESQSTQLVKTSDFESLNQRLSFAESKITDDSITNIVETNTTLLVKQDDFESLNQRLTSAELKITDEAITNVVESNTTQLVKQNDFASLTERVNEAELKITDEAITNVVESTSTVLVKQEQISSVNNRIDATESTLNGRIDGTEATLNGRIDGTEATLNGRIDDAESNLNEKLSETEAALKDLIGVTDTTLNGRLDSTETTLKDKMAEAEATLKEQIEAAESTLNGKLQEAESTLNDKLQETESNLNDKIDDTESNLNDKIDSSSATIMTRLESAESVLTKDGLTTIIMDYYMTESDVESKQYATASMVKQTETSVLNQFSTTGGFNLLRNTAFLNGITHWTELSENTISIESNVVYRDTKSLQLTVNSGQVGTPIGFMQAFDENTLAGMTYRLTFYYYFEEGSFEGPLNLSIYASDSDSDVLTLEHEIIVPVEEPIVEEPVAPDPEEPVAPDPEEPVEPDPEEPVEPEPEEPETVSDEPEIGEPVGPEPDGIKLVPNTWNKFTTTFTVAEAHETLYLQCSVSTLGTIYLSNIMLSEGSLEVIWTPHNDELYSGLTKVDSNGIEITMVENENVLGSTTITYDGLAIYDANYVTKAYFGRDDEAYVEHLKCNRFNAVGVALINSANPVVYVNPNSTESFPDGSTLATGFRTITDALNAIASLGTIIHQTITIHISGGYYNEDINLSGFTGNGGFIFDIDSLALITGTWNFASPCIYTIQGNKSSITANDGAVLQLPSDKTTLFTLASRCTLTIRNINIYNPNEYDDNLDYIAFDCTNSTLIASDIDVHKFNYLVQGLNSGANIHSVGYVESLCNATVNSSFAFIQSMPSLWLDATGPLNHFVDGSSNVTFTDNLDISSNNPGTPSIFDPLLHPALNEYTSGATISRTIFVSDFISKLYARNSGAEVLRTNEVDIVAGTEGAWSTTTGKYWIAELTVPPQIVSLASVLDNIDVTFSLTRILRKGSGRGVDAYLHASVQLRNTSTPSTGGGYASTSYFEGNALLTTFTDLPLYETDGDPVRIVDADATFPAEYYQGILDGTYPVLYLFFQNSQIGYFEDIYFTITGTLK